ncbi:hypothetical protein AGOR_G00090120 [Albula goreensis]|uniref:Mismatch repair endonuclease PMS2 n=1 Tax=Albula goreensis TaxID=1534307 RepID=A0A8T3DHT3_9TELE|nr:hypothetical protein AGOR_G00090120 [Albula goreensis]
MISESLPYKMNDVCSEPAQAIRPIDRQSVHQICSGQVVLSLATAVKELVENSIDAGATNVEIRLKEYGAELVEVADNGKGVEEANFEGLTLKHHTSKLSSFSDLIHVETFGFRGEALSSLCALSDLSVVTCHEAAQVGTRLVFDHNGRLSQRSPHPRQQGTTVTLLHLFSTLPVRHKEFQRNIKKEYTKMIHVLQSYCIISTGVRITCTNQVGQGKRSVVLCTSGSHSMKDNIGAVFGPKQLQSLLPFQQVSPTDSIQEDYGLRGVELPEDFFKLLGFVSQGLGVWGFVSQGLGVSVWGSGFVSRGDHGVGRSSTDRQFFFINSRPCDPSKVSKLVNEVYHMFNRHQYPFVALNITVASDCVDVNVTPDKRQIFLQEEKLLLATVKSSLIAMYETGVNKISLSQTNKISLSQTLQPAPYVCRAADRPTSVENPESAAVCGSAVESGAAVEQSSHHTQPGLSLAGLRAAFSLHQAATVGTKEPSGRGKPPGLAQRKLQCFYSSAPQSRPAPQSSVTQSHDAVTCSPVEGVESGVAQGRGTADSDPDSGRGSALSERGSTAGTPESTCGTASQFSTPPQSTCGTASQFSTPPESTCGTASQFSTPDTVKAEPCIKHEAAGEHWDEAHEPAEVPECKSAEPFDCAEDCSVSPGTKRPRLEESPPAGPPAQTTCSGVRPHASRLKVDAPVRMQRRTVPLHFSLAQLTARLQRLQKQSERADRGPKYRRFRAKIRPGENQSAEDELKKEIRKDMFKEMKIIGQFNLGFIITKLNSDIFMIDQHASDEKYNFEMLQQHTILQGQRLITPQKLHLPAVSETILIENLEIFQKNGFDFIIDEEAQVMEKVKLISLPTSKSWTFGPSDIEEMIFMLSDSPGVMCRPSRVRQMFASRACRKSVMIGTALNSAEMRKLVVHMGEMEQPWNCPHGRPTMRHLASLHMLSED